MEKGSKRVKGWGIYIINLATQLTGIDYALLQFQQNLAKFSRSSKVWQKYRY